MFSRTRLCSALELLFGDLACKDPDSFTKLPAGDGNPGITDLFQYYQPCELDQFITGLAATLCASVPDSDCISRVESLRGAVSVDLSYDTMSETLKLEALWPRRLQAMSAEPIDGHKTELGIVTTDPSGGDAHELGVGGFLASTPADKKEPSVLAFAVPSRHRRAQARFSAEFLTPQGLHPSLQLSISSASPPLEYEDQGACDLYAYLTLPRTIFADRYQLAGDLFLASKNLSSLTFASEPVDLEMPEYKTPTWGSTVLLELAPPETSADGAPSSWTAEIPLHLRYMAPTEGGLAEALVPYPAVFWACEAGAKAGFSGNPWDRESLGYDALFSPTTGFWHVEPQPTSEGADLVVGTKVPVLAPERLGWVELGTAAAILAGFAWVLYALFSASRVKDDSKPKGAARVKKDQ